jgi:hypothetical protein
MTRAAVALSVVLFACSTSSSFSASTGSASPGGGAQGQGKPARMPDDAPAGASDPAGPAPAAGAGTVAAAPAACVPAVNDLSTSLFSGRVLIRLPKGVELVEQNPFYAQSSAPDQTTSCGGAVRYAAVGFFLWPENASLTQVRDQLLELRGIPLDTVTWSDEGTRGRHYSGAYAAAQDPKTGAPPVKGWLVLRDAPGDRYAYFALFESEPSAFDGQRAAFEEAGRRLLVKPRALQGPEVVAPPPPPAEPKPKPKTK